MYLNKLVSYVTGCTWNKILYYMDRKKFALSDVNIVIMGDVRRKLNMLGADFTNLSWK